MVTDISQLLLFALICPWGCDRSLETQMAGWSMVFVWVNTYEAGLHTNLTIPLDS